MGMGVLLVVRVRVKVKGSDHNYSYPSIKLHHHLKELMTMTIFTRLNVEMGAGVETGLQPHQLV